MDGNIRAIQPISRDYTEVYSYPALIDGVPDTVVSGRLRDVQMRIGTAGMLNPDDVEVFAGIQNALNAQGGQSVVLSRGLGMEEVLPSGERIGHFNDETPQRAFWRQWRTMMDRVAERS
jgi:benzoate/toluate 1,2-dioxygenase alpha subunit